MVTGRGLRPRMRTPPTPKQGLTPAYSPGLNMLHDFCPGPLARQCLDRRIPDEETLRREVAAWEQQRNTAVMKVDWQFTTADARVKLKRLYPTIELQ